MEITYTPIGDYVIPDIMLQECTTEPNNELPQKNNRIFTVVFYVSTANALDIRGFASPTSKTSEMNIF